jgi:integrase/recombinase XerD
MDQIIEDFANHLHARKLSKYTISTYPQCALALERFCGDLSTVDEEVLIRYITHLRSEKIRETSIKRYFAALSTLFGYLVHEKYIASTPITPYFKKIYLTGYKRHDTAQRRQCPTIEQVQLLVAGISSLREKTPIVLLFKTGIRRSELTSLDVSDLNLDELTIYLKPTAKRSNETVFFDPETRRLLAKWLRRREEIPKTNPDAERALFLDSQGGRLQPESLNVMFRKHATFTGLHDPASTQLRDKLTPHCARHWFTTELMKRHCPREYIQILRGDQRPAAIDRYYEPDLGKIKEAYLDCIPLLKL